MKKIILFITALILISGCAKEEKQQNMSCTIEILCNTILDNFDDFKKPEIMPEDGVILQKTDVLFADGESVFDILQRICKENKIHLEFTNTPGHNSAYIEGISNIYEFDVNSLSGWVYSVNDWFPNFGVSQYTLEDGDDIKILYTCDLGQDVGK